MNIKLSKEAAQAIEILKDINKKLEEFKECHRKVKGISIKETNLIGALVIGIYCPVVEIGITGRIGNKIVTDGMVLDLAKHHD